MHAKVSLIKLMIHQGTSYSKLVLKMYFQVFANPEDAATDKKAKVDLAFEPVERVRR